MAVRIRSLLQQLTNVRQQIVLLTCPERIVCNMSYCSSHRPNGGALTMSQEVVERPLVRGSPVSWGAIYHILSSISGQISCCSGYRKVAALATAYKPEAAVEGTADAQPAAAQSLRRSVFQEALRSMAASEGASAEDVEVRRVCPEKCL